MIIKRILASIVLAIGLFMGWQTYEQFCNMPPQQAAICMAISSGMILLAVYLFTKE